MQKYPPREGIVDFARSTLMGPADGESEVVLGTPFLRYMTGILFPQGANLGAATDSLTATAEDGTSDLTNSEEVADDIGSGADLASEALPSAVGLSFKVAYICTIKC